LAGVVDLSFESSLTNTVTNYNSGRLKVLATTSSTRVPILNNIPTVAESCWTTTFNRVKYAEAIRV
jgi:tripartite-type tricarboxylate transporter receptor subunit TctC